MSNHKRQGLIFDGDDTLWDNQVFYDEAKLRFYEILVGQGGLAEYLQSAQIAAEDAMRMVDEIDMGGVEREGFCREPFSQSLMAQPCGNSITKRLPAPGSLSTETCPQQWDKAGQALEYPGFGVGSLAHLCYNMFARCRDRPRDR